MSFEERFVFEKSDSDDIICNEHLVRYRFAADFVRDKVVLDMASGSGYGSDIIAKAGAKEVAGVDIDRKAVEKANKEYASDVLKFKEGDAGQVPFADNYFDIALSFETIEHIEDYRKFLSELARVLKDDGYLIISTPNKEIFEEKNPYHVKEFYRDEFESELRDFFPTVNVYSQVNSMASAIIADRKGKQAGFSMNNEVSSHYFVAICGKQEFSGAMRNHISSNPQALKRLKNNPVLKASDTVYEAVDKLFKKLK